MHRQVSAACYEDTPHLTLPWRGRVARPGDANGSRECAPDDRLRIVRRERGGVKFRRVGKAKRAHHSFAEQAFNVAQFSSPIRRQHATIYVAMKGAVRPIDHACYVPMLDRIEMNVVDMRLEICFISDGMLPIAALPDAFFSLVDLALGSRPWIKASRKVTLDQSPTYRKVSITLRQRPNCVNMVR